MPEKNIRLKKSFITLDYHGALTLLLLALPPAPIKSLILSAMAATFDLNQPELNDNKFIKAFIKIPDDCICVFEDFVT